MARWHRENLTGEHKTGDAGQALFFCLFMVLWVTDIFFGYASFLNQYVPVQIRLSIGILLLIIAGYMAASGLYIVFIKKDRPVEVIRQGVFKIVRHPIYLSEIIMYLGLLVISMSLAAAAVWILAILFLHYISRHEEKLLLSRFGNDYLSYMNEVPMWFPCFRKRNP